MDPNKKYYCRCGKLKTKTNTSIQRNRYCDDSYRTWCRVCDAKRMREKSWVEVSDDNLVARRNKHLKYAKYLATELERRKKERINARLNVKTVPHAGEGGPKDRDKWGHIRNVGHEPRKNIHVYPSGEEIGNAGHGSGTSKCGSDNVA